MKISYRLVIIVAIFITCLITANIIAVKIVSLGPVVLPAAIFVFPLSYIFGDVLTEVYGYRVARRVIWLGFICNLIFVFFTWIGQLLPPAGFWAGQGAYVSILGYTPRLLLASFAGYLAGEFVNSFVLSRMKILTRGRWLWSRTVGSTAVGQAFDTSLFITLAFIGTPSFAPVMIFNHWWAKVLIEAVATPATYALVGWLKRREGIDTYDYQTSYNPFLITDKGGFRMIVKILGAHNTESSRTGCACFLVDDVLALDAGSLTSKLSFRAQDGIKAVLLTHRHYDHVKDLPALGMNFFLRGKSLDLYAPESVFNELAPSFQDEVMYPDFSRRPPEKPTFRLNFVNPGREVSVLGYKVLPVRVNHAVPCVGYQVTSPEGKRLFYTSDTGPGLAECWRLVSPDLLIIEVTFGNKSNELSVETGHLTPALLVKELEGFRALKGYLPRVVTVHANPIYDKALTAEIAGVAGALKADIRPGREGMRIEL